MYCRLNVHVGESNMQVIRAVRRRLMESAWRDPRRAAERKQLYRAMLREHKKARDLFTRYRF
jgi:hypothetical protein